MDSFVALAQDGKFDHLRSDRLLWNPYGPAFTGHTLCSSATGACMHACSLLPAFSCKEQSTRRADCLVHGNHSSGIQTWACHSLSLRPLGPLGEMNFQLCLSVLGTLTGSRCASRGVTVCSCLSPCTHSFLLIQTSPHSEPHTQHSHPCPRHPDPSCSCPCFPAKPWSS